ncbi:GNAT family N-acetyltransferase [Niallia circulans]|uniref:GNAT family N-acetyltransferase n=1 Tax=Niallia circulans TaxID=1397 RepID=UPI00155FB097|nr:GNAT family N-acetyltransferase [Niallia circulans]NRG30971.1 GNAT family N-acetyltransferase [Niallia circulans]
MLYRKFTANDFELYYQLVSNERVMAQITERAIPLEEAKADFEKLLIRNDKNQIFGSYAFFQPASEVFIGLGHVTLTEQELAEAELGYMLLPEHWGKGYGGVVADRLMSLVKQTDLKVIKAIIDPANRASRKILVSRGFTSAWIGEIEGLPGEILKKVL